ncbi:MAG: DUF935 family protein [Fimbriimonadaceae bacterium]
MSLIRRLFRKEKPTIHPEVPALTTWQQRALAVPGEESGALPDATAVQMQRDAMIQTALTIKKLGVLAAGYRIEPGDASATARRAATYIEGELNQMEGSPHGVMFAAMDAFARGWSIQELVFERRDHQVGLRAIRPKDPSLFGLKMSSAGRIEGVELHLPGETPRAVPRDRFVIYLYRPSYRRLKGMSDLEAAHPHWRAKTGLLDAWRLHLERFASPTVLGQYQRGLPAEEQAAILAALRDLHRNTAVVYPDEIRVDLLGGGKESSSGFIEAIEFHNREMARAILGQTLTTDEGRRIGSLALGRVHLQILLLQLDALRRELEDGVMTEQVIKPLVQLNFGDVPVPRFRFDPVRATAFAAALGAIDAKD